MKTSQKNAKLISALTTAAELVGEHQVKDGHEVGLNLVSLSERCLEEAQFVKNGLFLVFVYGTFSCGKSTIYNALLGSKLLPDSVLPSTAIITFIQNGDDNDDVEIHFKDTVNEDGTITHGRIEYMSKEEFMKTYQYSIADDEEFKSTGSVSRFKDVEYAVLYSSQPLLQDGVILTDGPGLEDKSVATRLALDTAAKAQAIICMCGERGFTEADREYFTEHFKGNPGNVFFVLNKLDRIESDEQRELTMQKMWNDVLPCFTNPDGSIDGEMMRKRVFCLSAQLALDARRGMTFDMDLQKDVPLPHDKIECKMERSNFRTFEESFYEFLTTDERCTAQYNKVFKTLLETYSDALSKVRSDLELYEKKGKITKEQKAECERVIREIEASLNSLETAFNNCTLKLQSTLGLLIQHGVDSIDHNWEVDLPSLHEKIRFGMKQYLALAISNINVFKSKKAREEDMKRLLQPFSTIIATHIADKVDLFMHNNRSVLESAIKDSEKELNSNLQHISMLFDRIGGVISNAPEIGRTDDQDWLQALISYCIGDASMIVKNCAGGRTAWMEFIRKAVFNALWQWTIIQIMTGGWGIIVCALIEWLQINNGKNELIDRMLTESKNGALKEIRAHLDARLRDMNDQIAVKVHAECEKKCQDLRRRLRDEKSRLCELECNLNDNLFSASKERERMGYIISTLESEIRQCYMDVFSVQYSEQLATL